MVSWSINCKDTETCEEWKVEDSYYEVVDITITAPHPALCSAAVLSGKLQTLPGICTVLSGVNVYSQYGQYVDDLVKGGLEYKKSMDRLTATEMAQICIAGRP
ncbi:hypothetical protein ACFL2V_20440 [Pseudomonadota bacterium]